MKIGLKTGKRIQSEKSNKTGLRNVVLVILIAILSSVLVKNYLKKDETNIPEFRQQNTADDGINSIIFKSHYLSKLKGASKISQFDVFYTRIGKIYKRYNANMMPEARHRAENILELMRIYQNRNEFFWMRISGFFDLKNGKNLLKEGNVDISATGSQKQFWDSAKTSLNEHKSAVPLLRNHHDGGILEKPHQAREHFMMELESQKLSLDLTSEDLLFIRVLENEMRQNQHFGVWGSIKNWFGGLFGGSDDKKEEEAKTQVNTKTDEELREENRAKERERNIERNAPARIVRTKKEDKASHGRFGHWSVKNSKFEKWMKSGNNLLDDKAARYNKLHLKCNSPGSCKQAWLRLGEDFFKTN